jgi:hypothetical protein
MPPIVWAAHGIAGGTGEIAAIGDLDHGETAMLFMIITETAIIWTTIKGRRIEAERCFRWLVVVADVLIIGLVGGDEHFERPMTGTML